MNTNQLPEQETKGQELSLRTKLWNLFAKTANRELIPIDAHEQAMRLVDKSIESSPNLPEDSAQAGKEKEQIKGIIDKFIDYYRLNASDRGDLKYMLHTYLDTLPSPATKPSPLPEDIENTVNNIIDLFKFHRYFDKPQLDAIRPLLRDELAKSRETDKRKVAEEAWDAGEKRTAFELMPQLDQWTSQPADKQAYLNNLK